MQLQLMLVLVRGDGRSDQTGRGAAVAGAVIRLLMQRRGPIRRELVMHETRVIVVVAVAVISNH